MLIEDILMVSTSTLGHECSQKHHTPTSIYFTLLLQNLTNPMHLIHKGFAAAAMLVIIKVARSTNAPSCLHPHPLCPHTCCPPPRPMCLSAPSHLPVSCCGHQCCCTSIVHICPSLISLWTTTCSLHICTCSQNM